MDGRRSQSGGRGCAKNRERQTPKGENRTNQRKEEENTGKVEGSGCVTHWHRARKNKRRRRKDGPLPTGRERKGKSFQLAENACLWLRVRALDRRVLCEGISGIRKEFARKGRKDKRRLPMDGELRRGVQENGKDRYILPDCTVFSEFPPKFGKLRPA